VQNRVKFNRQTHDEAGDEFGLLGSTCGPVAIPEPLNLQKRNHIRAFLSGNLIANRVSYKSSRLLKLAA
jgi:hypothetical protein